MHYFSGIFFEKDWDALAEVWAEDAAQGRSGEKCTQMLESWARQADPSQLHRAFIQATERRFEIEQRLKEERTSRAIYGDDDFEEDIDNKIACDVADCVAHFLAVQLAKHGYGSRFINPTYEG